LSEVSYTYTFEDDSLSKFGDKLEINGDRLILKQGLSVNTYEYAIKATASKSGYDDKIITKNFSLTINKADISFDGVLVTPPT
jgi:hypothetical protein